MGRRISKEFLHPSILEGVNDKIGNLDSLETDAKSNMVQAINELAGKIDTEIAEGKELIANAVGEPLTAEESFDEMSNAINGLLSTFKTNMMNNGVTVESGDKFKQLIDKIATMVEEGSGKGIQYAEGTFTLPIETGFVYEDDKDKIYTCNWSCDFVPTILFVKLPTVCCYDDDESPIDIVTNPVISNVYTFKALVDWRLSSQPTWEGKIENITTTTFDINVTKWSDYAGFEYNECTWYAIGVGEEDTTLRDSLADILENKGVDVTEEDDMASLITKVDSISGGLDIISATELPATGKENQICVITDNPTDKISISMNNNSTTDGTINVLLKESGKNIVLTNGNMITTLPIASTSQNGSSLDSYIYKNGSWIEFIKGVYYWYTQSDKTFKHTDLFGEFEEFYSGGARFTIESDGRIRVRAISTEMSVSLMTNVSVDMSKYSKIEMDITDYKGDGTIMIGLYADTGGGDDSYISGNGTHTFDLSNINKTGKLYFNAYSIDSEVSCYITEIRIYK